jgi:hypothetical protein
LLTIYVIAHYIAARNAPDTGRNTQPEIRLVNKRNKRTFYLMIMFKARLIFTIVFNLCFIPLAFKVIKDYERDEFSKRYVDDVCFYEEYMYLNFLT